MPELIFLAETPGFKLIQMSTICVQIHSFFHFWIYLNSDSVFICLDSAGFFRNCESNPNRSVHLREIVLEKHTRELECLVLFIPPRYSPYGPVEFASGIPCWGRGVASLFGAQEWIDHWLFRNSNPRLTVSKSYILTIKPRVLSTLVGLNMDSILTDG